MNKIEANISLLFITFISSAQNVFLIWIPDSIPHFVFICITNLLGFLMSLAFFFNELFRLDIKQVKQSMVLSAELIFFNLFLLLGVSGLGAVMTNILQSTMFVFIAVTAFLLYKQIPDRGTMLGIITVLSGLAVMTEGDLSHLWNWSAFFMTVSNICFAFYIVTISEYSSTSNPAIIAMGQMFFSFLFSLILWIIQAVTQGIAFTLPSDPKFWGSVIYISFFIRLLYSVVQMYAQRYTSPLNAALIFSTEIIITMAISPVLAAFMGTKPDVITPLKIAGGAIMIFGIMMTEPQFFNLLRKLFHAKG